MKVEKVNSYLREKGLTLGSVESFTGGLFAQQITSVGGASKFYKGGYITYATEEKVNLLLIPQSEVDKYGVVSKEIAYHMANNARQLLKVDVCVSFTGNAGPEAMEDKPVGEIHIGIAFSRCLQVFSYNLEGSREEIQNKAIEIAFNLLRGIISANN